MYYITKYIEEDKFDVLTGDRKNISGFCYSTYDKIPHLDLDFYTLAGLDDYELRGNVVHYRGRPESVIIAEVEDLETLNLQALVDSMPELHI